MDIIVDTREQQPLFKNSCIKYGLISGDYSTMKLRHTFAIERKSLQDLYGTITSGHVRFRKSHIRALVYGIHLVVYVEGTKANFEAKKFPGGRQRSCKGETLIKIVDAIATRWPLEIIWCNSRQDCKNKIRERLYIEELKLLNNERTKGSKNKKGDQVLKR